MIMIIPVELNLEFKRSQGRGLSLMQKLVLSPHRYYPNYNNIFFAPLLLVVVLLVVVVVPMH